MVAAAVLPIQLLPQLFPCVFFWQFEVLTKALRSHLPYPYWGNILFSTAREPGANQVAGSQALLSVHHGVRDFGVRFSSANQYRIDFLCDMECKYCSSLLVKSAAFRLYTHIHSFVSQIIAFDDLKTDYKNPVDLCNSLNPVRNRLGGALKRDLPLLTILRWPYVQ